MILYNENKTFSILLYPKDEEIISTRLYVVDNEGEERKTYYRLYVSHDIFAETDDINAMDDLRRDILLNLGSKNSFTIKKTGGKFVLVSDMG